MEKRDCESLAAIVEDLLSYDENRHKRILDKYFDEEAKFSHPLLTTTGTYNIRKVYRVWISLNAQEPSIIETPIFDGETAIVRTIQHIRPRIIPFIHLQVPAQTMLRFRERDDGKIVIQHQVDTWTLDALIQSVPIVNWWYERVVRVAMGKIVSGAGSFIYTANLATHNLSARAGEITDKSREVISQAQVKGVGIVSPIITPYSRSASNFVASNQQKVSQFTTPYTNLAHEILVDGSNRVTDLAGKAFTTLHGVRSGVMNHITGRTNEIDQ